MTRGMEARNTPPSIAIGLGEGLGFVSDLRALDHDDDQGNRGAEHAAQHRGGRTHGIDARLDVPGGQRLHEQQAARRAERSAHLRCTAVSLNRSALFGRQTMLRASHPSTCLQALHLFGRFVGLGLTCLHIASRGMHVKSGISRHPNR